MTRSRRPAWKQSAALAAALLAGAALVGAACGSGTSSGDKTKTAAAGSRPAPTTAATTAATSAATTAATSAVTSAATTVSGTAPSGTASAGGEIKTGTTSLGVVLTDSAGKTLYVFDNDTTPDKSSCNGGCATNWPPVTTTATSVAAVSGANGTFTVITRDDGSKQIAYKGKPLYRFAADSAAGDTKGDGVGGIWHAAKP